MLLNGLLKSLSCRELRSPVSPKIVDSFGNPLENRNCSKRIQPSHTKSCIDQAKCLFDDDCKDELG